MTDEFFRFPHTPHLVWLGEGSPRDDKVLSPAEAQALLADEVVVEEKLDGANLGISVGPDGTLRIQSRGQYLVAPYTGQFERLAKWVATHEDVLFDSLGEHLVLFGEWCAARHSVAYDNLPDWFLVFDVYERSAGRFWSTSRRDALARCMGLSRPVSDAHVARAPRVPCAVGGEPLPARPGGGYRGTRGVARVAHRAR